MKRYLAIFLFISLFFASYPIATNEPQSQLLAISLRVLQVQLKTGESSRDILTLGGIKRIDGFIVDDKNRDVILFGTTGSGPAIYFDDFVTALRSVWLDNSAPGCSIDPTETTLLKIREVNKRFSQATSVAQAEQLLEEFKLVGAEPQNVRVLTIPRNTHFAQVMVEADYFTKRISNGTAVTDLEGFKSLAEIATDKLKHDVAAGKNSQMTMYNRFWFTPGKVKFEPGNGIVRLTACEVKLLTEQQFLSTQGKLVGSGNEQPLAQQFVREFTKRYDDIAGVAPKFAELKSLFRFVAIAKALNYADAFFTAGFEIDYFLNKYTVRPARVPQTLPGITEIKKIVIPQNNGEVFLWLLSFGGVEIDIQIDQKSWPKPKPQKTIPSKPQTQLKPSVSPATTKKRSIDESDKTRDKILQSRPSSNDLKWSVTL
ncbi:MAG: DUF1598 domain-containing protein [bacterium]|nr:DUF1598 domain-containing protein [bacterium]